MKMIEIEPKAQIDIASIVDVEYYNFFYQQCQANKNDKSA